MALLRTRRIIGPSFPYAAVPVTSAASYTGPGDVVAGATAFYGLRAYTAASIGTAAVRLARPDTTQADIATTTGGGLNLSDPFFTGGPYTVVKLYDQVGGFHLDNNSNNPAFVTTGNGLTVPNIGFVAASSQFLNRNASCPTVSQPYTMLGVANHATSAAQQSFFFFEDSSNSSVAQMGWRNSAANQAFGFAQSVVTQTASDNNWHSLQGVFTASPNARFSVDNSATGTDMGTGNISGAVIGLGLALGGTQLLDGFVAEFGLWPVAFTGTQLTNMYQNQRAYYGNVF